MSDDIKVWPDPVEVTVEYAPKRPARLLAEAIRAEFIRQARESRGIIWSGDEDSDPDSFGLDGSFDLDEVAAAAVRAIREFVEQKKDNAEITLPAWVAYRDLFEELEG